MTLTIGGCVDRLSREALVGAGEQMYEFMRRLFPLCRSISGEGLRRTLALVGERVPLEISAVPSGTQAFDWTVDKEWNVRDAYIADSQGRRIVDFREHNLHLVSYSTPVRRTMMLEELRPYLHTLPDHPDWIPYRTTYYHRTWGFCLTHRQLQAMREGPYEVVVDSSLGPGELTYGELIIPGDSTDEVIFSAHACHPSLANDNLSGLVIATQLARKLLDLPSRRFTYRFLFAPGTIGSIAWLSRNSDVLPRIRHGLVLTGLGGPGKLVYKRTRRGVREIDRSVGHVVCRRGGEVRGYSPYGYDERQFNSIGFDLPVGRLSRTPHGEYVEYHTSADNLDFVTPQQLASSYGALLEIVDIIENNRAYQNLSPYGEPQLGRRGLYPAVGGKPASQVVMDMLWTLAYADGRTPLLEIAELAGKDFRAIRRSCEVLKGAGLLRDTGDSLAV